MSRSRLLAWVALVMVIVAAMGACQARGTATPTDTPPPTASLTPSSHNPNTPISAGDALRATREAVNATVNALATAITYTPTITLIPTTTSFPTSTPQPLIGDGGALPVGAVARIGIGYIQDSDLSPDGQSLALATTSGIYVYEVEGFQRVWRRYLQPAPTDVWWSLDGARIALGFSYEGGPLIFDASSGERLGRIGYWFEAHWSPSGSMIAVEDLPGCNYDAQTGDCIWDTNRVYVHDSHSLRRIRTLDTGQTGFYGQIFPAMAWSPDSTLLAVGLGGGYSTAGRNDILIVSPVTGEELIRLSGHSGIPFWLAFSYDNRLLASVSDDGTVIIWDLVR